MSKRTLTVNGPVLRTLRKLRGCTQEMLRDLTDDAVLALAAEEQAAAKENRAGVKKGGVFTQRVKERKRKERDVGIGKGAVAAAEKSGEAYPITVKILAKALGVPMWVIVAPSDWLELPRGDRGGMWPLPELETLETEQVTDDERSGLEELCRQLRAQANPEHRADGVVCTDEPGERLEEPVERVDGPVTSEAEPANSADEPAERAGAPADRMEAAIEHADEPTGPMEAPTERADEPAERDDGVEACGDEAEPRVDSGERSETASADEAAERADRPIEHSKTTSSRDVSERGLKKIARPTD